MIYLGLDDKEKVEKIKQYQIENSIEKVFVISADKFKLSIDKVDHITYTQSIEYVYFYRWLQEINPQSLIVLNECLRTQNRYDLTYNCIRHYLNQTNHQLIFQKFPLIDTEDDFMILFDFDTRSKWKRKKFDLELIKNESAVMVRPYNIRFNKIILPVSNKTKKTYEQRKKKMFDAIGLKDPHIIPRNLYLLAGKEKKQYVIQKSQPSLFYNGNNKIYLARNKRLNIDFIFSYNDDIQDKDYVILEFPHRYIDFLDFLQFIQQTEFDVVVADLKVDNWYFDKYVKWSNRLDEIYSNLQQ